MQVPQLHLGVGTAVGPLSIFPIWTSGHGDLAMSTGAHANVAVNELPDGAQVGKLIVSNNGPRPRTPPRRRTPGRREATPNLRPRRHPWCRRDPNHRDLLC